MIPEYGKRPHGYMNPEYEHIYIQKTMEIEQGDILLGFFHT